MCMRCHTHNFFGCFFSLVKTTVNYFVHTQYFRKISKTNKGNTKVVTKRDYYTEKLYKYGKDSI